MELAKACLVCLLATKGSTNLADVGVMGGYGVDDEDSSPDALAPNLSVERERNLVFNGVIGFGAAIFCPECVTPLNMD